MEKQIKDAVLDLLKSQKGIGPMYSAEISKAVSVEYSLKKFGSIAVRGVINRLRKEGWPIIASSKGYRLTDDPEELLAYICSWEARIEVQKDAIFSLRRHFTKLIKK